MYTGRYHVLRHRRERVIPVTEVFLLSQWPGWAEYDSTKRHITV